jgi:3-keto-5-aminohexanoate cleavage enzyme
MTTWNHSNSYDWMERLRGGFDPVIITCAVDGGIQGKESNPAIPETPEEIAAQAYEAYNAGASMVHIHARDPEKLWDTTLDPQVCAEVNALVRQRCPDLIINNTTGGGPTTTMEDRFRGLEARPEMASLNMGPDMSRFQIKERRAPLAHPHDALQFDVCLAFTYGIMEGLAGKIQELGIIPEMEMYHGGNYWVSQELIRKGLVMPPYVFQFVMGYQTSVFPTPENVIALIRELPPESIYFVAGIGVFQLPMTTLGLLLGGHVRVGLEDNVYYSRGRKFAGNGEAVERAVRIARELNREIATPAQAREMLGLSATPSTYPAPASVA